MIQIELRSNMPIYEQIVHQVKALVLKGALKHGDAMPSIRRLAESTRTNPNTVARAYQELERIGLIETLIGKGAFIREQPEKELSAMAAEGIRQQLKPPIMEWMLLGFTGEQIHSEVDKILEQLRGESK